MNHQNTQQPDQQTGIDLDNISFDEDGAIAGLDDDLLDSVSGGVIVDKNGNCEE